jgi:hypothetical protein
MNFRDLKARNCCFTCCLKQNRLKQNNNFPSHSFLEIFYTRLCSFPYSCMVNAFIPELHRHAAWNENQPWLRVQESAGGGQAPSPVYMILHTLVYWYRFNRPQYNLCARQHTIEVARRDVCRRKTEQLIDYLINSPYLIGCVVEITTDWNNSGYRSTGSFCSPNKSLTDVEGKEAFQAEGTQPGRFHTRSTDAKL